MNKKELLEYIRTVFISLLIALFIAGVATGCSKVIAEHHAKMLAKISNNVKDMELIVYLINRFKESEQKYPGDYSINVKLGNLYQLIYNYEQAEINYKKAISKSPFGVYSSYLGLADLYIKQAKYQEALNIVKQLKNTNHKPLLVAKGDFYMNLGDAFWEHSKYQNAIKQYKIAFFYYKKVDSRKKDIAINGILDCYNKLADMDYKNHSVKKAIENLETALLYKETPIIYYKLAILYKDIDPVQANEYMEKTYKSDPGLINFNLYEEILIKLVTHYYYLGKDIETDLYKQKLKSMRNFQKRYALTENDIKIDIVSLKTKQNLLKTKKVFEIKYKISNTSKYDFNTLFLLIKLRGDNYSKEIFNHKLYSKKSPLKSRTDSVEYTLNYTLTDEEEMFISKNLWLDFYVSRKDNMRKLPVLNFEIKNKK